MKKYAISTFYSKEDEGYIATYPQLPSLSAFGESPAEAVAELQVALEAAEEVAKEKGKPLPTPGSVESLSQAAKLLNISEIARRCDLNVQTLTSKIKRGTELAPKEQEAVCHTLQEAGILLAAH